MEKLGISYNVLQDDLCFLYDANKINPFSDDLVHTKFKNGVNIYFYKYKDIVGAA